MFFRVRTRLTDTPGALATLAQRCGESGVNILALQIYPELGSVTDDVVIKTPDSWTAAAVVELVGGAGGDEVSVVPCTTHDLVDQPTQWLAAACAVIENPDVLPAQLTRLLGPRPDWSATEQVRAASLTAVAETARRAVPETPAPSAGAGASVEYDVTEAGVVARIGRHRVGAAALARPTSTGWCEGSVEVAPAWRRLGIGRELLSRLSRLAAGTGAAELVLLAPASDDGVVALLAACGLRGRIRLTDAGLSVHVSLGGVRPLGETVGPAR